MAIKKTVLPVFLQHAGCKNRCDYCNQRNLVGSLEDPAVQIDHLLSAFVPSKKRPRATLAFYGGDFLRLTVKQQETLINLARSHKNFASIDSFRASVRPDSVTEESASWLAANGFTTVEVGAQCFNDRVLTNVHRGHTARDTRRASAEIMAAGMELGLHLMFGLPGQSEEMMMRSVKMAAACKPTFVRLFPTIVIAGTELARQHADGIYEPLTNEDALRMVTKAAAYFRAAGVGLAQIGLHPSEPMVKGDSVVAGPFDPRFGERVRERLSA
jgi:histone acetyltransferase (RNA polymerase elongator complex component)